MTEYDDENRWVNRMLQSRDDGEIASYWERRMQQLVKDGYDNFMDREYVLQLIGVFEHFANAYSITKPDIATRYRKLAVMTRLEMP